MIKRSVFCFVLIVFLTKIDGKCHRKQRITSISSGTSFGKCIGYCRRSINITSHPYKLIGLKEPNYDQNAYPPLTKEYPYSSNEWNQLLNLLSSKGFRSLNDTIGCPDCADGGAEWIQINWPDITRRVTFEYGKSIDGFDDFIDELRQLREQSASNL